MPEARLCPECQTELPNDAPQELCPKCLLHAALSDSDQDLGGEGPGTEAHHSRFNAPSPAELAPLFPQLEILELLGQGGMGAVYKARQTKLDRLVALKILPPVEGRDSSFAERFAREARALARLSHSHIVGVHDFGEADGLYYFIMEFVDGANLRQLLLAGQLDPAQALILVPQICEALEYAHQEEIVHRDIKPENILVDKRGRVKIADFGLAKLVARAPSDFALTGSRQVMGTPHYMAPEQMERPQSVDHRADIYSLGVVFYEMLTGELPLGRFAPPSQKVPMDGRLDEVVLRALAKEPEQRYQRISELSAEVSAIAATTPPAQPRVSSGTEERQPGGPPLGFFFWGRRHGIIRLDGNSLVLEVEVPVLFGLKGYRVEEKRLLFKDIASITMKRGWFQTVLLITPRSLSVLVNMPCNQLRQIELVISREDRPLAEQLVAGVKQGSSVGSLPRASAERQVQLAMPSVATQQKPRVPRRGKIRSFWNSVRYYMIDSVADQSSASMLATSSLEPSVHASAPMTDPRSNKILATTTGWAIGLCLLGVGTSFLPWVRVSLGGYPWPWIEPFTPWYRVAPPFIFLAIGLLIAAFSSVKPVSPWRPFVVIIAGVAVTVCAMQVVLFPPNPILLILQGYGQSGVQGVTISYGPGPFLTGAVGIGLAFLGAVQCREVLARGRSYKHSHQSFN